MSVMYVIIANFRYVISKSITFTGVIFAILGFIGLFAPLNDCFDENISIVHKIFYSGVIVVIIWLIVFTFYCTYTCFKKKYKLFDVGNGHAVYVQYGDLFSKKEISGTYERRNLVIPVNRCFDTIVDDDLISLNTIHGICMKSICDNFRIDANKLNEMIQEKLSECGYKFEELNLRVKRKGNLKRYEVGSIAEIPIEDITYFFLGLTQFDKDLHASIDDDDYVLALIRMIMFNQKRSQRYPLVIPLIGSGAANTKKEERDILEFIVKLLKMNKSILNCDIHIVVRKDAKNRLSITSL